MQNALIVYSGLVALAAAEASPLGYLLPGTLAIIGAGGLIQSGQLNCTAALSAVWVGVVAGDLISFVMAKKCGEFLRRWKVVAGPLARAEARLKRHPLVFVFGSHLSPFLKNLVGPAAGLTGMSWSRFLPLEIAAALLDAGWFLGLGFALSAAVGSVTSASTIARIVSAVAIVAVILCLIGRGRKCAVPRRSSSALAKAKRGFGFLVKVAILIGPWEAAGRLARRTGEFNRLEFRAALVSAIAAARPGDVILVGRDVDAPWGQWSHAGLIVQTPNGEIAVLHAYEGDVRVTGVRAYPMPGRVAILRFNCTEEQRRAIIAAAWSQLGAPFRLGSRKPGESAPKGFNCVGLVEWAFAQAGINLSGAAAGCVVVPDDLLSAGAIIFQFPTA
ncbi:MAG TPA: VTT domain-containing protein [Verrucomicrobiae bacterium]